MSRVCHVVRSDGFAGVERYVCDVSSELAARGWDVLVIGGDPARMRAALGEEVLLRPARTTLEAFGQLSANRPYDVVHSHMTAADVAASTSKVLTRASVVSTRHFTANRGSRRSTRALLRPVLRGIDRRLAISQYVADGARGGGEHVLLNGVPRAEPVPDAEREEVVVVLQRHEAEKDTTTALRAWAASELPSRGWRLALAGSGVESDALRRLAEDLGIADSVDVLGFVPDPSALLRRSRALLATAAREPFGLAVVEAMATGAAVIAAGSGGHLETVGGDGWLFPPGDAAACAALLDRLHATPSATTEYGERLRTRQREELSLDRHVDVLERHYRSVMSPPASGTA
ncbi:MAG: epsD [Frankiales bacterium]|nr:epsD [Frankiales bacterium]